MQTDVMKPGSGKLLSGGGIAVLVVWAVLFLLPFSRLQEAPVAIMFFTAFWLFFKKKIDLKSSPYRYYTLAFLCIWLPMVLSLPDAVNFERSMKTTLGFVRFYFMGLFVIWALKDNEHRNLFIKLTGFLALFWAVDAVFQFMTGVNFLGFEMRGSGSRLTGIFKGDYTLGLHLTLISIFAVSLFFNPYDMKHRNRLLLALAAMCLIGFVVIAGGSRNSWLMFSIIFGIFWITVFIRGAGLVKVLLLAFAVLSVAGSLVMYEQSSVVKNRVDKTIKIFSDNKKTDLTTRMKLWEVAAEMFKQNPLNGVGARGYRYSYKNFSASGDKWLKKGVTPTHPHQVMMEIASDTGAIGILGYLVFLGVLLHWWGRKVKEYIYSFPAMLVLVVVVSPFNSHWALYSSAWGLLFFFFVALYFAFSFSSSERGS